METEHVGGLEQLNSLDSMMVSTVRHSPAYITPRMSPDKRQHTAAQVRQQMELCEILTGWEQKNKYQVTWDGLGSG